MFRQNLGYVIPLVFAQSDFKLDKRTGPQGIDFGGSGILGQMNLLSRVSMSVNDRHLSATNKVPPSKCSCVLGYVGKMNMSNMGGIFFSFQDDDFV